MPQRRIKIPEPIHFKDLLTGLPIPGAIGTLDFQGFLIKLFANPLWNESWKHGQAQQSITRAYQDAVSKKEGTFDIAEEDWTFLVNAAKTPKTAVFTEAGIQVITGFLYSPTMAAQILPMQLAVINAETV
jgi:hypothetical protein